MRIGNAAKIAKEACIVSKSDASFSGTFETAPSFQQNHAASMEPVGLACCDVFRLGCKPRFRQWIIQNDDIDSEVPMARQFGLKRSTEAEQSASAAECSPETLRHADDDATLAPQQTQHAPLYAPASWRGNKDRRSISVS